MKKLLFLLFIPVLAFGQIYEENSIFGGYDSVNYKYILIRDAALTSGGIEISQDGVEQNLEIVGPVDISGRAEVGGVLIPSDSQVDTGAYLHINGTSADFTVDTTGDATAGGDLTVTGDIINAEILKITYDVTGADTGTGASRYIVFRVKKLNGDTLTTSTRFMMHLWASTSEFGTPSKLSLVTIGNLTTGTKIYSPFALNWNPEGTVDHVLTDATGRFAFTMTSTGNEGMTAQWFMIEIGGKLYSFSFNMFNFVGGG